MLEPRHIVRLQLQRERLTAHEAMPKPRHVTKPLTGQFAVIGDAIITELLGISPEDFRRQLQHARERGVEFIGTDKNNRQIGISAATSLIKGGPVLAKNVIVPNDFMKFDRTLDDHIVIAAFVRGEVNEGKLDLWNDAIEIAGWTTVKDVEWQQQNKPPAAFKSKLQITAFPCAELMPIERLYDKIDTTTVSL